MPALPAELRPATSRSGIGAYDANLLTETREKAMFFEAVCKTARMAPKSVAHSVNGDLMALMNAAETTSRIRRSVPANSRTS